MKRILRNFCGPLRALVLALLIWPASGWATGVDPAPAAYGGDRRHLVFHAGTPQEIEVFKIFGRQPGPTIMIIGGIQGDEPGGYLSADLYAELALRRGNLIVVPRANFKSVVLDHRGPDGDMNRKFGGDLSRDPDQAAVEVLKGLMAESDLLLNLHDGSGFYRPTWESNQANPNRYGQCIIADTEVYVDPETGRTIPLGDYARKAVDRVNLDITEPLYKFHFFNTNTGTEASQHAEQRRSATYYALTRVGIPAFGIETSKSLPNLEMKIHQHNLAVNAFLDLFGVEIEQPRLRLDQPEMSYAVISVNQAPPLAVADGQALQLAPGDTLEVHQVTANYDRGLSADVLGLGELNDIRRPVVIEVPTAIEVKKDNILIGRISIEVPPTAQAGQPPRPAASAPAQITGFIIEIDGRTVELTPGQEVAVLLGSRVKMVDLAGDLPLSQNAVMNLKGFVPKSKRYKNNGEDRSFSADTSRDLVANQNDRVYKINAEWGKKVLASCALRLVQPQLATVTLEVGGASQTVKAGESARIAPGAPVTITDITLVGGHILSQPHFTLGGQSPAANSPMAWPMPSAAANLSIFNGNVLAGWIRLVPDQKE